MHYYSFHIADFALHTSHLNPEEEGVYRRLLDFYYDTESPIPKKTDRVIRRLRLVNHTETVQFILEEFFVLMEDGWHNLRADYEIKAYNTKAETARENGKKGGRPKKNKQIEEDKPKKTQSVILANQQKTGSKANHKPITNNHKPIVKNTCAEKSAPVKSQNALSFENSDLNYGDGGGSLVDPPPENQNSQQNSEVSNGYDQLDKQKKLLDESFHRFWNSGIRKINKKKTRPLFERILKTQSDPDAFVTMVCEDVQSRLSAEQLGFDQMHPTTYLNGERWNDEQPKQKFCLHDHPEFEWVDLASLYNEKLGDHFGPVSDMTSTRQESIMESISYDPGKRKKLEWWGRCFDAIGHSVLVNPSPNGWRPDFDFLIKADTIAKLREGRYAQR